MQRMEQEGDFTAEGIEAVRWAVIAGLYDSD